MERIAEAGLVGFKLNMKIKEDIRIFVRMSFLFAFYSESPSGIFLIFTKYNL